VTKKINKLVWVSAADYEFQLGDEPCTVQVCSASVSFQMLPGLKYIQEYFHRQNQRLKFPNLPIMAMVGKTAAIPLELLKIVPGQPYRGVLPEAQAPKLLDFATQKPMERLRNLRGSLTVRISQ
jgi:eukaryotic translation initiation factor 2C